MSRRADQWDPLFPAQAVLGKSIHLYIVQEMGRSGWGDLEPGTFFVARVLKLRHVPTRNGSPRGASSIAGTRAHINGICIRVVDTVA